MGNLQALDWLAADEIDWLLVDNNGVINPAGCTMMHFFNLVNNAVEPVIIQWNLRSSTQCSGDDSRNRSAASKPACHGNLRAQVDCNIRFGHPKLFKYRAYSKYEYV